MSPLPSAPGAAEVVLTPCDLPRIGRGGAIWLGGRVVSTAGAELIVADAWAQCRVALTAELIAAHRPEEGSWLLARGELDGEVFRATALTTTPGRAPTATTEHGRLAWTGRAEALLARQTVTRAVREYFREQGFIEVETPTLVPCPGLDAHVHSLGGVERGALERDFLITSPELHLKRLVVGGMPRVFEIARCFRAEELGPYHEPEFTLVEWYRAFAGYEAVLGDTEQLVVRAAEAATGAPRVSLVTEAGAAHIDVSPPFERLTVRQAFARYAGVTDAVELAARDEARYFETLVSEVEPALAAAGRPVFLTHYPASQASLARRCPADPSVAERFELYVAGLELCNGFGELTDPAEQRRRFEAERARRRAAAEPVYPLDERFLSALGEGLPPSAGNALGLDRLVLLAAGVPHVATVQAFPAADR